MSEIVRQTGVWLGLIAVAVVIILYISGTGSRPANVATLGVSQ